MILTFFEFLFLALLFLSVDPRRWDLRKTLLGLGLFCSACGDFFLVALGSSTHSTLFLAGIGAFSCAHLCWILAACREGRPYGPLFPALLIPLGIFLVIRVLPFQHRHPFLMLALAGYTCLSILSLAAAWGTRRFYFSLGIGSLLFSDVLIGCSLAHIPHCHVLVGPFYLLALLCLVVSFLRSREPLIQPCRVDPRPILLMGGFISLVCFVVAMVLCPVPYNPCTKMLSYLGRTRIQEFSYPSCHYLFSLGLFAGALSVAFYLPYLARSAATSFRRHVIPWFGAFHFSGLLLIIVAPENVNPFFHNGGCHLAVFGALGVLVALDTSAIARRALLALSIIPLCFLCLFILHGLHIIPFAPWITTCQKLLILSLPTAIILHAFRTSAHQAGHVPPLRRSSSI